MESLLSGVLLLRKNSKFIKSERENSIVFLIGDVYNISILKSTLGKIEGNVWAFNDADVLCSIREKLGDSAISLAEGDFCLLIDHGNGYIEVITESRGLNLYFKNRW